MDEIVQAAVASLVTRAAGNAYARYWRQASIRLLAWRAEQRHALAAVDPEVWAELDLDDLFDLARPARRSSHASTLGRQLYVVLDNAKNPSIGIAARHALDAAGDAGPLVQQGSVSSTLAALEQLARPLARYAPPAELAALFEQAVELDSPAGHRLAQRVESIKPEPSNSTPHRYVELAAPADLRTPPEGASPPTPINEGTHVNVGFVETTAPRVTLPATALRPDTLYWMWIGVGPREDEAIDGLTEPILAEHLEGADEIDVALFPDDGLAVSPTPAFGTLAIAPTGAFPVRRPAMDLTAEVGDVSGHRLFFGLRTPPEDGAYRVRCGVFVRGLLVHVEQVTVAVGGRSGSSSAATTFRLTRELTGRTLGAVAEHRLSVYLNSDEDGSHTLTFYGRDGAQRFANQANIDGNTVRNLLRDAREALHIVSWGGGEYRGAASRYEPSAPGRPYATSSS